MQIVIIITRIVISLHAKLTALNGYAFGVTPGLPYVIVFASTRKVSGLLIPEFRFASFDNVLPFQSYQPFTSLHHSQNQTHETDASQLPAAVATFTLGLLQHARDAMI
jgi:hypothetical protein